MWKYNGKSISVGKAWIDDNGIQHPANWHIWSASDKAAAGLVEFVEDTPPDSRLYSWSMDHEGKITKKAKSLADINLVDEKGDPVLDDKHGVMLFAPKLQRWKQRLTTRQIQMRWLHCF
jgi:hypothetical protein